MINTDDRLVDELSDSELKLLMTLAKYGKKSRPENDVLLFRTKWGINKLQKNKKALTDKNLIKISNRFKKVDGKILRDSNLYEIITDKISKFNGNSELHDFDTVHDFSELHDFDTVHELSRFELVAFELLENDTDKYLLKSLFIKNSNLLKYFNSLIKERDDIKDENEKLKKELSQLKKDLESKEKNSAKKEKSELFPENSSKKSYQTTDKRSQEDKNELRPFSHDNHTARLTLDAIFPTDNVYLKREYKAIKGIILTDDQISHAKDSFIEHLNKLDVLIMINHVAEFKRRFLHWWIEKDLKHQSKAKKATVKTSKNHDSQGIQLSNSESQNDDLKKRYG